MNRPTVPPELENEVLRALSDSRLARAEAMRVYFEVLSRSPAEIGIAVAVQYALMNTSCIKPEPRVLYSKKRQSYLSRTGWKTR
jgi:hypothetical protein